MINICRLNVLMGTLALLSACAPTLPKPASSSTGDLTPYFTLTPSPTFAQAPEVIFADTPLPTATPFTYTVKEGDTMSQIAEQFHIPLDALIAANPNVSPNAMSVGQTLLIPTDVNNPTGEATSTPAAFTITQVQCYTTTDGGMWCFALAHNDSDSALDNVSAIISLHTADGARATAQTAILPLDLLPAHASLPLTAFFPAPLPPDLTPRVLTLSAISLAPNDPRYLRASLNNVAIQIAAEGRSARISGMANLSNASAPAKSVWVAAVAYDDSGRVVGFRRWEWSGELTPRGSLLFDFVVSGFGSRMKRVEAFVEARP